MKKLKTIILSRFKKESQEDWVEERRRICKVCEYNSKNKEKLSIKERFFKFLSDLYTFITFSDSEDLGECECLCSIYYKTLEETEECFAKEKGEEDKWKSIYKPNSSNTINGKRILHIK